MTRGWMSFLSKNNQEGEMLGEGAKLKEFA